MLRTRDRQCKLFAAATQIGATVLGQLGFYGQLATAVHPLFEDEDFQAASCADTGRPSCPPSMLATARLLQHDAGVSDAEVVERCQYDLRWKVALDLDLASIQAPFVKRTFQAFRVRLTLHAQEGLVFERSVQAARQAGLSPARLRVALDSTPVRGRGSVKDTFNLLSDAIMAVVRAIAATREWAPAEVAREARVERHLVCASIKGSELVDWGHAQAVDRFLGGLLHDCAQVVAWAEAADCASDEVALLRKVIAQDIEPQTPEGPPRIQHGVAPDRTVSVHDPEMRHGRKSSGKVYTGHKAHIAVEVTRGVITAVEVSAPADADGARVGLPDRAHTADDGPLCGASLGGHRLLQHAQRQGASRPGRGGPGDQDALPAQGPFRPRRLPGERGRHDGHVPRWHPVVEGEASGGRLPA